jgi:ABC-type sulfate/molybdate transport systems ATPase subunit
MIGCRNLRVQAGRRELLHVPELDVPAGSVLAVLGPDGAGKTTLLRALGLLGPHRITGDVLLDGHPATRAHLRIAAAAVLQRPILRRGTVAANVAGGLRFRGAPRAAARERAAPWLDRLGIAHLADRDARTLSGGEAQRTCLARALALDPRVLLLDEPFTGLDATTRADLVADLAAALAGRPTATVLVTHDPEEAAALADDVAVLVAGQVRRHGPTSDVFDDPRDLGTARLLGFTNVVGTRAARPEHTRLGSAREFAVAGRLRRILTLGPAVRLDVDTCDGPLTCLYPDRDTLDAVPDIGAEVSVVLDRHKIVTAAPPVDRPARPPHPRGRGERRYSGVFGPPMR